MTRSFTLHPVPPFRLDLTVWCLRRRAHNVVDRWDGETYRRVLVVTGEPIEISVGQAGPPGKPAIEVSASRSIDGSLRRRISATITRMLGLDRDLRDFYRIAHRDPILDPVAERLMGMKPPRFPSVFEALANAVACQLVSLTAGLHVLNRIAEALGETHREGGEITHAFPEPRDVMRAEPQRLRELGLSLPKARSLIGIAKACSSPDGGVLNGIDALDDDAAIARLCELGGVGRWSAEYALLRGLGRINIFPADDIGGRNKLKQWLKIRSELDYGGVRRRLERWHPYAGLIYFHLLVNAIAEQNVLL